MQTALASCVVKIGRYYCAEPLHRVAVRNRYRHWNELIVLRPAQGAFLYHVRVHLYVQLCRSWRAYARATTPAPAYFAVQHAKRGRDAAFDGYGEAADEAEHHRRNLRRRELHGPRYRARVWRACGVVHLHVYAYPYVQGCDRPAPPAASQ